MSVKIVVPALGESINEATIAVWHKKPGDAVEQDELLLELETEKVTLEVNAPSAGVMSKIMANEGDTVNVGQEIGILDEGAKAQQPSGVAKGSDPQETKKNAGGNSGDNAGSNKSDQPSPAAAKIMRENNLTQANIDGTGKDGRITKHDALSNIANSAQQNLPALEQQKASQNNQPAGAGERQTRVRMTRLRQTIAQRLKESQNTAAILSTFNEIDMSSVISYRKKYKEIFEKKHAIKLGFMSFFVKATVAALRSVPAVNAQIDGNEIVYNNFYDLGIAVGTPTGLVVPVVRNCDIMGMHQIESKIAELGKSARDGKLAMSDLTGGSFSISNGGVYGSLLSTPIINPPQSGILGLHKIQERPVAIKGEVKIRPMMYVALSYDHRIVDGKEAVTFLVKVKEFIENPERLLLEV